MRVVVVRELRNGERRVALVPSSVKALREAGFQVVVEAGAGDEAGFPDSAYEAGGADVAPSREEALEGADILLKVAPPLGPKEGSTNEVEGLSEGLSLLGFLDPLGAPRRIQSLADAGITAYSMELIPRVTRAQKMDALSSQATVAGYRAVLLGALHLPRFLPMLMTAAGTIPPARMLVLGAGVAGLQAIATGRRLGASVSAFDVRPAVKEQVESLGARFLETEVDPDAEAEGGYARELTEAEHEAELELVHRHAQASDLVITTAQIPGRRAPVLLTRETVDAMPAGAVVVDLAAATGGNCTETRPDEVVQREGVRILGPTNLPAEVPTHASEMYSRNISALLLHLAPEGELNVDSDDEIATGCLVTQGGEVRHPRVQEALNQEGSDG